MWHLMADIRPPSLGTDGWNKQVYAAAVADMPDTVPQYGTDVWYRGILRSTQAATASNFVDFVNGDLTSANYHDQRALAQDGVQSGAESTTPNGSQMAGNTAVAAYYSPIYIYYPFAFKSGRQRTCFLWSCFELAALSQNIGINVVKRQGASVTGSITDPLTSTNKRHPTQVANYQGEVHRMNV